MFQDIISLQLFNENGKTKCYISANLNHFFPLLGNPKVISFRMTRIILFFFKDWSVKQKVNYLHSFNAQSFSFSSSGRRFPFGNWWSWILSTLLMCGLADGSDVWTYNCSTGNLLQIGARFLELEHPWTQMLMAELCLTEWSTKCSIL